MIRRILDLTLGQAFYCIRHFTVNTVYVLLHFWKIPKARRRLKQIKAKIWTIPRINDFLRDNMTLKSDKGDRRSWPTTVMVGYDDYLLQFIGDCDDYLTMSKYLAKRGKFKTQSWSIFGWRKRPGEPRYWAGHALCIIKVGDVTWIADNKKGANVRRFVSWKVNFGWASERIKRWY